MPRKRSQSNHIHKYQLKNYGKRKVYACTLPDCTHFMIDPDMVKGKQSLCNQCLDPFILTNDIIAERTVRPRCKKCRSKTRLGGPKLTPEKVQALQEEKTLDDAIDNLWKELKL